MTELLDHFHFLRPLWLIALLPALLLAVGLWQQQASSQIWRTLISPHLLPYLLDGAQIKQRRWPMLGLLAVWALTVLALAGPVWNKISVPVERNTDAIVICWDLSPSMLAEDVKPSRLTKSRLKIIDLLNSKADGQAALIAYSAEAYTVTPLTDDFQTIVNLLPALAPTTLPTVGSNPEMALEQAIKLLKDGGVASGQIIMLTDEIASDAISELNNRIQSTSHQVTFWGIGSTQGAPIPLPEGGFAKDGSGNLVVAKLNEAEIQQLSRNSGAYYVPVSSGEQDIDTLRALSDPDADGLRDTDRKFEQWYEYGQFLPLLLVPFAAVLFRRGIIFVLLIAPFFLLAPRPALAFEWQDLWLTENQQAQRALEAGDKDAALRFTTPEKRGVELFKQGRFDEAAEQFTEGESAEHHYNLGTSLSHAGKYAEAIEEYEKALEKKPEFPKAAENLEITKQLRELAQQDDQQQDSGENGDESQKNSDGEESEQDQQQAGDPSSQDSDQQQNGQQSDGQESEEQSGQQTADNASTDATTSQDNPFATQQSDAQSSSAAAELSQTASSASSADSSAQAQALYSESPPLSEEDQKLEQWLRKVPDDPSGLMRNKFRHQYMQRQQQMGNQLSPSQKDAENRW